MCAPSTPGLTPARRAQVFIAAGRLRNCIPRDAVPEWVPVTLDPPPGDPQNSAPVPDLKASDSDRERAVEVLRVAAGDGRLTPEELEERLEAALSARTSGELVRLTADLPAPDDARRVMVPRAKEVVRINQSFGNVVRNGPWVVPRRLELRTTGGNVKLDFTKATLTGDTLTIDLEGLGGNLSLVTRPGISVDVDELTVSAGNVKVRPPDADTPIVLRVEVSGHIRGGNVIARPPRRTLRQWLRRRPRF